MKRYINLLPRSYCRWQIVRRRLLQWGIIWIAAAIAGGGLWWHRQRDQQSQFAQLRRLERQYAPLKKRLREVTATKALIDDLQKRESLALELADEQSVLTLLGIVSRAAKECEGNVCVQHLSLVRMSPANKNNNQSPIQRPSKVLALKGLGASNFSIARFAASLRDAQVFDQVGLESAAVPIQGDERSRSYQIQCTF